MIIASIVTYKTDKEDLRTIIECVDQSLIDKVYIIDNSPTEELREFEKYSSKIVYIFGQGNIGYGAGHNLAITKAIECGAKYHVVLNPDIYFDKDVIQTLADYMDVNTDVGQVMPKVIYPNGEIQYLCKLFPTPLDLIGRRFIPIKSYIAKRNEKFEMRQFGYDRIIEVPFLSGCFMFLRIEALKCTNGFSEKYWMYCEDIDLCRRIGQKFRTMYYSILSKEIDAMYLLFYSSNSLRRGFLERKNPLINEIYQKHCSWGALRLLSSIKSIYVLCSFLLGKFFYKIVFH